MHAERKTLLIVDDNRITARCVGHLVRCLGFGVALAFHGKEALRHLAQSHFAAVITDVDMPDMSGFELLLNIRLDHPQLPVALMTSSPCDTWREAAHACDAWAFLEKPVSTAHVVALLGNGAQTRRPLEGMHVFRPQQTQSLRAHQAAG